MTICDSCTAAFEEEGAPMDALEEIAWMGADIADHICDKRESDGEVACDCACSR